MNDFTIISESGKVNKKAAFHNLGCKVNSYELDVMRQILRDMGYEEVPFHERADVYVVNTCTVTNIADRKSRQMLHRAKKQNPDAVVIAAGCYVETDPRGVRGDEAVDLVIGNNKKSRIGRILEAFLKEREKGEEKKEAEAQESRQGAAAENLQGRGKGEAGAKAPLLQDAAFENMQLTSPGHTRAFIKIQDGCNQFCSYCIIPYARGRIRSREKGEILREVKNLVEKGVREIVLTGIHVSSYGLDFPDPAAAPPEDAKALPDPEEAPPEDAKAFPDPAAAPPEDVNAAPGPAEPAKEARSALPGSVRAVRFDPARSAAALLDLLTDLEAVSGLERIRLSSLEPRIMTEGFIRALSEKKKICPHFHLSLQSGCDETLRRMNRHYTTEEFARSVELLRSYYDRPAITTDVIVGFPGETEAEFEKTCAFLEKIRFYEIHVFRYSRREGTAAAKMKVQIPEPVKALRSDRLLAMTAAQAAACRAQFMGEEETLLIEEPVSAGGQSYWVGSTARYVTGAVPAGKTDPESEKPHAYTPGTLLRGRFGTRTLKLSRGDALLFEPVYEPWKTENKD